MAESLADRFDVKRQLSPNQQNLLLAALSSNNPNSTSGRDNVGDTVPTGQSTPREILKAQDFGLDSDLHQDAGLDVLENGPLADFLAGDGNFPFDEFDEGHFEDDGLPSVGLEELEEHDVGLHSKRKIMDDEKLQVDISSKKQEGEDKVAKKPGRKPLTSEPTTKRKAQNRAAQRAFRERKEKHLKDLEDKADELEKRAKEAESRSKAAEDENGLLRAQMSRLQNELYAYRRQLSLESAAARRSATSGSGLASNNGIVETNSFQFEFPRFGTLPGSHVFGSSKSQSPSSPTNLGSHTTLNGISPGRITGQGVVSSPSTLPLAGFDYTNSSPEQWNSAGSSMNSNSHTGQERAGSSSSVSNNGRNNSSNVEGGQATSRVFRFNSTPTSNTDSPSASSVSQYGGQSSCETSPEPSHSLSPQYRSETPHVAPSVTSQAGKNKVEATLSPFATSNLSSTASSSVLNDINWFADQNGGQFDPELLGGYREPQAAIVGNGEDFTNGFFNDAWSNLDMSSPFSQSTGNKIPVAAPFVGLQSQPVDVLPHKQDVTPDGKEVVLGDESEQMLSCDKIWEELQSRPNFKDDDFDIDNLCSELRSKARCSESGVVIDRKDVDAALNKIPNRLG